MAVPRPELRSRNKRPNVDHHRILYMQSRPLLSERLQHIFWAEQSSISRKKKNQGFCCTRSAKKRDRGKKLQGAKSQKGGAKGKGAGFPRKKKSLLSAHCYTRDDGWGLHSFRGGLTFSRGNTHQDLPGFFFYCADWKWTPINVILVSVSLFQVRVSICRICSKREFRSQDTRPISHIRSRRDRKKNPFLPCLLWLPQQESEREIFCSFPLSSLRTPLSISSFHFLSRFDTSPLPHLSQIFIERERNNINSRTLGEEKENQGVMSGIAKYGRRKKRRKGKTRRWFHFGHGFLVKHKTKHLHFFIYEEVLLFFTFWEQLVFLLIYCMKSNLRQTPTPVFLPSPKTNEIGKILKRSLLFSSERRKKTAISSPQQHRSRELFPPRGTNGHFFHFLTTISRIRTRKGGRENWDLRMPSFPQKKNEVSLTLTDGCTQMKGSLHFLLFLRISRTPGE